MLPNEAHFLYDWGKYAIKNILNKVRLKRQRRLKGDVHITFNLLKILYLNRGHYWAIYFDTHELHNALLTLVKGK